MSAATTTSSAYFNKSPEWTLPEKIRLLELYMDRDRETLWDKRAEILQQEFSKKRSPEFFAVARVRQELHNIFSKPNPEHHIHGMPIHPRSNKAAELWLQHFRKEYADYRERKKQMFAVFLRHQLDLIRRYQQGKVPPEEVEAIVTAAREKDSQRPDRELYEAKLKEMMGKAHNGDLKNIRTFLDYFRYIRGERVPTPPPEEPEPPMVEQLPMISSPQRIQGSMEPVLKGIIHRKHGKPQSKRLELAVEKLLRKMSGNLVVLVGEEGGKNGQKNKDHQGKIAGETSEGEECGKASEIWANSDIKNNAKANHHQVPEEPTGPQPPLPPPPMEEEGPTITTTNDDEMIMAKPTMADDVEQKQMMESEEEEAQAKKTEEEPPQMPTLEREVLIPVVPVQKEEEEVVEEKDIMEEEVVEEENVVEELVEVEISEDFFLVAKQVEEDHAHMTIPIKRWAQAELSTRESRLAKIVAQPLVFEKAAATASAHIDWPIRRTDEHIAVTFQMPPAPPKAKTPEGPIQQAMTNKEELSPIIISTAASPGKQQQRQAGAAPIAPKTAPPALAVKTGGGRKAAQQRRRALEKQQRQMEQQQPEKPSEKPQPPTTVKQRRTTRRSGTATSSEPPKTEGEEEQHEEGEQQHITAPVADEEEWQEQESPPKEIPHAPTPMSTPSGLHRNRKRKRGELDMLKSIAGESPTKGGTVSEEEIVGPPAKNLRRASYQPSPAASSPIAATTTSSSMTVVAASATFSSISSPQKATPPHQQAVKEAISATTTSSTTTPIKKSLTPTTSKAVAPTTTMEEMEAALLSASSPSVHAASPVQQPKPTPPARKQPQQRAPPPLLPMSTPTPIGATVRLRSSLRRAALATSTPSPAVDSVGENGLFLRPGNHTSTETIPKQVLLTLWKDIRTHRHSHVFDQPVREENVPGYHLAIKQPMDLKTLRARIESGEVHNFGQFSFDILKMFANAIMYNSTGHFVNTDAKEMLAYAQKCIQVVQYPDGQLTNVNPAAAGIVGTSRQSNASGSDAGDGRFSRSSSSFSASTSATTSTANVVRRS